MDEPTPIKNVFERVFSSFKEVAQKGKLEDTMRDNILKDLDTIVCY